MDATRDKFTHGRKAMIDAFADMTTLAYRAARNGTLDYDEVLELHGRFFDGNVEAKRAFAVTVLLAEIRAIRS